MRQLAGRWKVQGSKFKGKGGGAARRNYEWAKGPGGTAKDGISGGRAQGAKPPPFVDSPGPGDRGTVAISESCGVDQVKSRFVFQRFPLFLPVRQICDQANNIKKILEKWLLARYRAVPHGRGTTNK
jgi:hypothetical protein